MISKTTQRKVSLISWNACCSVLSDEASNWNELEVSVASSRLKSFDPNISDFRVLYWFRVWSVVLGLNTTIVGYGYRRNSVCRTARNYSSSPLNQRRQLSPQKFSIKTAKTQFQFQERRRRRAVALNDPVDEMTGGKHTREEALMLYKPVSTAP